MKNIGITFLLIVGYCCIVVSQDSVRVETTFDIDINSRHILPTIDIDNECIFCPNQVLGDNPINHTAVFGLQKLNVLLNEKYDFDVGLLLEQRGFSFGNYTRANLVVIPYINFTTTDTLNLFGKRLKHSIKGGDFWNEDVSDIVRLYNIDYQGVDTKIGVNNIWFRFLVVADLTRSIGLEIGEIHRFSLEYRRPNTLYSFSISNNIQINIPQGNDITIGNYFEKIFNDVILKTQFDVKLNKIIGNGVAGSIVFLYKTENLNLKNSIRYYSSNYNKGFKDTNVRFGNPLGQLYPIKNYFRSLSQWALFTDYQETDVINYELGIEYLRSITRKIKFDTQIDFNLIYDLANSDLRLLPAYHFNLDFNFTSNFRFEIGMTNKHMEMNNYFQSSSLSVVPNIIYGFSLDLEGLNNRTTKKTTTNK